MRTTVITPQVSSVQGLPRGWIIVGLAFASWLAVAGAWVGLSEIFEFVASAL